MNLEVKLDRTEMSMIRWIYDVFLLTERENKCPK